MSYLREDLRELIPYTVDDCTYRVKLDANESPFDLPNDLRIEIANLLLSNSQFNRYPDSDSKKLREKLAIKLNWNYEQIMIGTGSDELLQIIINAFVNKGEYVLCPYPSFGMYSIFTKIAGGIPIDVYLNKDFSYCPQTFISNIEKYQPKIVFLCSPNNPTGNSMEIEQVEEIIQSFKGIVVIDEAYMEFSKKSFLFKLKKYDNVIILRTFSKAYGLAALRIGYLLTSHVVAKDLYKVKPPYNVSGFSQEVASLVLDNESELRKRVDEIISIKEELTKNLENLDGVETYPSDANFILIRVNNAQLVFSKLLEKGILVRNFKKNTVLESFLRITIGTREESFEFLASLKKILREEKV